MCSIVTISSALPLTQIQKDVLVGTLLGDASAERQKASYNSRIRYDQTYPTHASYLYFIYDILKPLTMALPTIITRKPDARTGISYRSIAFKTRALSLLNVYYDMFYINGRKSVPTNIAELLTPRALAF